jgi:hypothetical protein
VRLTRSAARYALVIAAGATVLITAANAGTDTPEPRSLLEQAVAAVKRNAANGHGSRADRLAWAIHRYVQRRISPSRNVELPASERPNTVEEALRTGAGSCGNSSAVALAIAKRVGLRARPVQFYYALGGKPASHMAWEAWVDGGWQFHDAVQNAVYPARSGRLLSIRQLWRMPARVRLEHFDTGPGRYRNKVVPAVHGFGERLRYLIASSEAVIGGTGTVNAWRVHSSYPATPNRPDYVGITHRDGTPGSFSTNLALRFRRLRAAYLRVAITGTSCTTGQLMAQSQITTTRPVATTTATVTLPVRGTVARLSVKGGCAVVISGALNVSEPDAVGPTITSQR